MSLEMFISSKRMATICAKHHDGQAMSRRYRFDGPDSKRIMQTELEEDGRIEEVIGIQKVQGC